MVFYGLQKLSMVDLAAAVRTADGALTVSAVNKYDAREVELELPLFGRGAESATVYTVTGATPDSFNDVDSEQVTLSERTAAVKTDSVTLKLPPHSVNLIVIQ